MSKKLPKLNLPSADDLFTTQTERNDSQREKVQDIPLSEIDPFPDHPFLVKMDESMQTMADSVRAVGIQTPAVVRLKEDGRYELVSGHRRKMACELAGLESLPCIVRAMTQDEAIIAMVDANLQREVILPSEKAKSYKMKLDAMKRQSGRPANNCAPVGLNSDNRRSREILAENSPDSHSQIQRYIRLTDLIPSMLNMVDEGQLPMRPAVELSYLPHEQQQMLLDVIEAEDRTPSHAQATKMRKLSDGGQLDYDEIQAIMREYLTAARIEHFKLPRDSIARFFPLDTPAQTIEETIIKALELWHKKKH